MKFYRACCKEEYENSKSSLHYIRRYKWISNNKDFILERVCDGEFNNSKFKDSKYTHMLEIHIEDLSKLRKLNSNEYMMDRRNNVKVNILNKYEIRVDKCKLMC